MNTKKILFIGLSCVGDVVMTSTVIKTLQKKFPQATIDFVADKRSSNLYERFPSLGKIVIKNKDNFLRGTPRLIKELWKTKYDIIVDVRTDGLAYLLRGKKKYTKLFSSAYGEHAVEDLMGVIFSLHKNNSIPETTIWLSEQERKNTQEKLSLFDQKDRLLAICVGDIRRPVKCWSGEQFIKLLNNQNNKFTGVIFLGGDLDAERTEEVAKKINLPYINTISCSLLETAAFLEKAIIYIGPDSGVGHIASAVKTPVISFFSVDRPERCRPWGKSVICLKGADNDARNIPIESVNNAIQEILNE